VGDIFVTAYGGVGADRDGPGEDGQSWFRNWNNLRTPQQYRCDPVTGGTQCVGISSTRCHARPVGYGCDVRFARHRRMLVAFLPDPSRQKANRLDLTGA
jgi:hypothetical protein